MKNDYYISLRKHYEKYLGKCEAEIKYMKGKYQNLPEKFHLEIYSKDENTKIMITSGLGLKEETENIEFFIYYSTKKYSELQIAEIMYIVSYYHYCEEKLFVNHIVNLGKPIVDNSKLSRGYLSWPYIEKKEFHLFSNIKIMWFLPISESEYFFIKRNGINELEELFEETSFNYIDLTREPVV